MLYYYANIFWKYLYDFELKNERFLEICLTKKQIYPWQATPIRYNVYKPFAQ